MPATSSIDPQKTFSFSHTDRFVTSLLTPAPSDLDIVLPFTRLSIGASDQPSATSAAVCVPVRYSHSKLFQQRKQEKHVLEKEHKVVEHSISPVAPKLSSYEKLWSSIEEKENIDQKLTLSKLHQSRRQSKLLIAKKQEEKCNKDEERERSIVYSEWEKHKYSRDNNCMEGDCISTQHCHRSSKGHNLKNIQLMEDRGPLFITTNKHDFPYHSLKDQVTSTNFLEHRVRKLDRKSFSRTSGNIFGGNRRSIGDRPSTSYPSVSSMNESLAFTAKNASEILRPSTVSEHLKCRMLSIFRSGNDFIEGVGSSSRFPKRKYQPKLLEIIRQDKFDIKTFPPT